LKGGKRAMNKDKIIEIMKEYVRSMWLTDQNIGRFEEFCSQAVGTQAVGSFKDDEIENCINYISENLTVDDSTTINNIFYYVKKHFEK
jgi:hypothetical protein